MTGACRRADVPGRADDDGTLLVRASAVLNEEPRAKGAETGPGGDPVPTRADVPAVPTPASRQAVLEIRESLVVV